MQHHMAVAAVAGVHQHLLLLPGYTSTSCCSSFSLGSLTAGQSTTKAQPADTTLSPLVDHNKMMPWNSLAIRAVIFLVLRADYSLFRAPRADYSLFGGPRADYSLFRTPRQFTACLGSKGRLFLVHWPKGQITPCSGPKGRLLCFQGSRAESSVHCPKGRLLFVQRPKGRSQPVSGLTSSAGTGQRMEDGPETHSVVNSCTTWCNLKCCQQLYHLVQPEVLSTPGPTYCLLHVPAAAVHSLPTLSSKSLFSHQISYRNCPVHFTQITAQSIWTSTAWPPGQPSPAQLNHAVDKL